jgi:hypothetical protein
MSTHSRIGIQNQDGSVTSVYCNWDGYTSYVGAMLLDHYSDESKVRALISLGDLSVLGERVSPNATERHSYDTPAPGVCVFYLRDRGEEEGEFCVSESPKEWVKIWERFNYLYRKGAWYIVTQDFSGRIRYRLLTQRNTRY